MTFAPPTVYFCPSCNKPMLKRNYRSYTVHDSASYSDGYRTGGPRFTPDLAKCPNCTAVFFLHNLWAKKEDAPYEETKYYKDIAEPDLDDYIKAVQKGLAKNADEEKQLRTDLWRRINGRIRGTQKELLGDMLVLWQENCAALLPLMEKTLKEMRLKKNSKKYTDDDRDNCIITIAELKRNLGRFNECVMSIKELGRDWSWLKKQYIGECKAKNPFTFELLFKDELNLEKNEKADKYDYVKRGRKYLAKCYGGIDIEKALADYHKAEELGMDGQRFYEERGLIYLSDLNNPDNAIADFTKALSQSERCPDSAKAVTHSWRSQAYREKGDFAAALADIQAAIELDSENSAWYYYRKMIHELMGNTQAAEWDWFKCELLYCLKGEDNATFFETQHHYSYTDEPEFYIATNNEGLEIRTKKREGEPIEPEILYSGRGNALFRRRPYQFILLTGFSKGWGQNIFGFGKVFVKENRNEKFPSSVPDVEAYPVKVRRILEPLDSLQNNFRIEIISIAEDGYPFLTALRALVYQHKDKTISEVICKEDLATLACILVREEDYEQLERFAAEFPDLLNEAAPAYFRPFRPTPLYYATLSLICGAMKDPVKMLRWLIDHGADPNKACGGDKCTPLGNQCFVGGNIEVMKILLSAGADPNKPAYQNDRGLSISPLFVVLCPDEYNEETHKFKPLTQGNVERAKLLVKAGANVNEINEAGETPLDMAITYSQAGEQAELLDLFRKSGADVDTALRDMEK